MHLNTQLDVLPGNLLSTGFLSSCMSKLLKWMSLLSCPWETSPALAMGGMQ